MCARSSASKSITSPKSHTTAPAIQQAPSGCPTLTPMMKWKSTIRSKSARTSSPLHSCRRSNPLRRILRLSRPRRQCLLHSCRHSKTPRRFLGPSKPPHRCHDLLSCRRSTSPRRFLRHSSRPSRRCRRLHSCRRSNPQRRFLLSRLHSQSRRASSSPPSPRSRPTIMCPMSTRRLPAPFSRLDWPHFDHHNDEARLVQHRQVFFLVFSSAQRALIHFGEQPGEASAQHGVHGCLRSTRMLRIKHMDAMNGDSGFRSALRMIGQARPSGTSGVMDCFDCLMD